MGMPQLLLMTGAVTGLTLSGLLALTIANKSFRFWPTPGKGSRQSFVFWGLFRSLNVIALALAFLDWRPGTVSRSTAFTVAATGLSPKAFIAGREIRNTQPRSRPISAPLIQPRSSLSHRCWRSVSR
jgi:hypothetical protein